ncbi:MAG: ABC transporter ATP-binding protein [Alphaproteobacteria bacterium]|nr:ABC transporter ATP-binding protein [Alphaproteobacteria bacterium]
MSPTATEPVLVHLDGLRIRRGPFTLEIPAWDLRPGRVVGLVGGNGAGKTTLLRHLAGLSPRDAGTVSVLGRDPVRDPGGVRSVLGFMADDLPVFDLRVDRLLRTLSGYYPGWDPALVEHLLGRFELDPRQRARDLSKGQAVRLRLICVLAWRPEVVVLDEPAAGLDLTGRRRLLEAVLDVVQDERRSVVVSSHILTDVERIADELLVLRRGRVVAQGPTPQVVGEDRTLEEALLSWEAA